MSVCSYKLAEVFRGEAQRSGTAGRTTMGHRGHDRRTAGRGVLPGRACRAGERPGAARSYLVIDVGGAGAPAPVVAPRSGPTGSLPLPAAARGPPPPALPSRPTPPPPPPP